MLRASVKLYLDGSQICQITDQGVASLLAPPTAGVLPSLEILGLGDNQYTQRAYGGVSSVITDRKHRADYPRCVQKCMQPAYAFLLFARWRAPRQILQSGSITRTDSPRSPP